MHPSHEFQGSARAFDARFWHSVAKQVIDFSISAVLLIALMPLMAIIALLVRLDSDGPSLYRQTRVGRDAKTFTCYKFRTMYQDADPRVHMQAIQRFAAGLPMSDDPAAPFKLARDPRITRIGALLRKTSLDELPQLFNVLHGDMSLVGPRPAIPYELVHYQPTHHQRHQVKPGITGLWQVMGRGTTTFDEMLLLDIEYVDRFSVWLDLKLLLLTVPTVLAQRGAR